MPVEGRAHLLARLREQGGFKIGNGAHLEQVALAAPMEVEVKVLVSFQGAPNRHGIARCTTEQIPPSQSPFPTQPHSGQCAARTVPQQTASSNAGLEASQAGLHAQAQFPVFLRQCQQTQTVFWEPVVGHAGLLSRRSAGITAEMADAGI